MQPNITNMNISNDISTLNSPIAESTLLEDRQNFLKSPRGIFKRRTLSPISNASKQLSRTTLNTSHAKIEPHVITDAQSNGLVSRIVKYHENSQNEIVKNKSLYSKFGQFPIVHLTKNEIKYSPRNNLIRSSSVRIAPPEKTIFNRSYRNAVLRSNSMMQMTSPTSKLAPTLMKKDEANKIINNNEPLPPTVGEEHHYPIQSKSVLDALKEISRKRINNEEISLDRTKKYCYGPADVPDSPLLNETVNSKRPREPASPTSKLPKKMKIRNNDILSSLSSSLFVNRRPEKPVIEEPLVNQVSAPVPIPKKDVEVIQKAVSEPIPQSVKVSPQPQHKRLVLFNKRIDSSQNQNALGSRINRVDEEEDDEIKINFVKPKSQVVGLERKNSLNSVEKSKLSLMLSCLSGDLDEPDNVPAEKPTEKIDTSKTTDKPLASISFATTTTSINVSPISVPASQTTAITKTVSESTSNVGFQLSVSVKPTTDSTDGKKNDEPAKPEPPKFTFGTTTSSTAPVSSAEKSIPTMSFTVPSTSSMPTFSIPKSVEEPKKSDVPANSPINFENKEKSIATSVSAVSSTITTSAGGIGGISFLGNTTTSGSTLDPNKSLISFGTPAKSSAEPAKPTLTGFSLPATSKAGFSFGAPSTATNSTTVTTTTTASSTFGSSTGFSANFGSSGGILSGGILGITGTQKTQANTMPTPSTGVISFGTQNPPTTTSSITSGFFSASPQTTIAATPSALPPSILPVSTTPSLSFQNPVTTTTAPATANVFGFGSTTAAPSFNFGNTSTAVQPQSQNNNPIVATTSTSSFSFGSNAPPSYTQSQTQSTFSFGNSNNSNATVKPAFSFGAQSIAEPTKVDNSNSPFGIKPVEPSATTTFGAPIGGTNMFGQTSTNTNASIFGTSSAPVATTQADKPSGLFNFQSSSNVPVAGSGGFSFQSQNPAAQTTTTTASGVGFSFQSPATTTAAPSASGFGFQATTTASSFSFGSTAPTTTAQSSGFSFSQAKPTEAVKPFGFSGSVPTTTTAPAFGFGGVSSTQTPQSTFGSNTNNFSFSASGQNTANQSTTSNVGFGGVNNNAGAGGDVSVSFNMKLPGQSGSTNIFGQQPQNNPSSTNIFGQTPQQPTAAQNPTSAFSFGGSQGPATNQSQSKPFAFGGTGDSSQPAVASNVFGSNSVSAAFNFSAGSNPQSSAFNFQAPVASNNATNTNLFAAQQPAGNMFSIGTGGNTAQRRPIRQATRRLK